MYLRQDAFMSAAGEGRHFLVGRLNVSPWHKAVDFGDEATPVRSLGVSRHELDAGRSARLGFAEGRARQPAE